jgi:hypothetical protein
MVINFWCPAEESTNVSNTPLKVQRLSEWQAKGLRIDVDEIKGNENRVVHAIPGPARRKQPQDWALTAVPRAGKRKQG